MGNCAQNGECSDTLIEQWSIISVNQYFITLENNKKHRIQKWISTELQNTAIYERRKRENCLFLPKLQGFGRLVQFTNNSRKEVSYVITQTLTPFKQMAPLTLNQALEALKCLMKAMRFLCEKYGLFEVCSTMIYWSGDGNCILWINPNVAINSTYLKVRTCWQNEILMVEKVVKLVEEKCLSALNMEGIKGLGFKKALIYIERFCKVGENLKQNPVEKLSINSQFALTSHQSLSQKEQKNNHHFNTKTQLNKTLSNHPTISNPQKDPDDMLLQLIHHYHL